MEIVSSRARFATYNASGVLTVAVLGDDGVGFGNGLIQVTEPTFGAAVCRISSAGNIAMADGSAGFPSYSFISDFDTGLYWTSSGKFSVTSNGATTLVFDSARITFLLPIKLDNAKVASAPIAGGTVTMLYSTGATIQVLVV